MRSEESGSTLGCAVAGYIGQGMELQDFIGILSFLHFRAKEGAGIAFTKASGRENKLYLSKSMTIRVPQGAPYSLKSAIRIQRQLIELVQTEYPEISPDTKINTAIGHLRWATVYGAKDDRMAHPFVCGDEGISIAIVHNGEIGGHKIIHFLLQAQLGKNVYNKYDIPFNSDSAVIAPLTYLLVKQYGVEEGIRRLAELTMYSVGTYGTILVLVSANGENRLFYVKKEAPLIIFKAENGIIAVSDIYAVRYLMARHGFQSNVTIELPLEPVTGDNYGVAWGEITHEGVTVHGEKGAIRRTIDVEIPRVYDLETIIEYAGKKKAQNLAAIDVCEAPYCASRKNPRRKAWDRRTLSYMWSFEHTPRNKLYCLECALRNAYKSQ